MDIKFEQLPSGVAVILLNGRMDITGAMRIDVQFAAVAAANRAVVVDLGGVEFMASMGLRTLIMGAKSMHSKSGRMVLYRPTPMVEEVLVTSGTTTIIPLAHELVEAEALALG
ncbi:STAS domain-containing protein [Sediminicoccus sp. KRV36]|uniref:STAS domain-containing protein n=1 Tax=Sediminicoccus sp. KRV36 TaxID=3133721 RepID=UPI00200FC2C0|nr:STAS domain-containing protein [Sediminicoccus rosea]UPY37378.1 STAS domain-containing protein [Sediminicoccus rosea]